MLPTFAYGALLGLVIGLTAGLKLEHARRSWADLRALKAQIPVLRNIARRSSKKAVLVTAVAAAFLAWSLFTIGGKTP